VVLDLTWSVVKDVVGWAASAKKAARSKAQHRIANVVEHCGVLVAGVNKLNAQVVALVGPLTYFSPAEWDIARRAELVNDLILFAEESVVVPRMRSALATLSALVVDVNDPDIARPAQQIHRFATRLFVDADALKDFFEEGNRSEQGRGLRPRPSWANRDTSVLVTTLERLAYGFDADLADALPALTRLIRSAQTERDVDELQDLAKQLMMTGRHASEYGRPRLNHFPGLEPGEDVYDEIFETLSYDYRDMRSAIAPFAAYMQIEFGRLIAAQQRRFPEMPSPTWVF
jgi:hypothetical protein